MSKEQIILDVYREHCLEQSKYLRHGGTIQEFIDKCKTDTEFSEKWGLKIEERELSFKERRDLSYEYAIKNNAIPLCIDAYGEKGIPEYMETINNTGWNIPTKLITITYNDTNLESYE